MVYKNKIKQNKGYSMVLAILVIALSFIFIGIVTSMSINKIKSTNSQAIDIESKYMCESGVEIVVADIKYQIKDKIKKLNSSNDIKEKDNSKAPYINSIKNNLKNSKEYMELVKINVSDANKVTIKNIQDDLDKLINTNSLQSKTYYDGISDILNRIIDLLYSNNIDDNTLALVFNDAYLAINQLHKAWNGVYNYIWYYEKHYINIDNTHKHLSTLLEWDPQKPWISQNTNADYVRNEIINGFVKDHWSASIYTNIQNIIYINEVQKKSPKLKDDIARQLGDLNTLLKSGGSVNGTTSIWAALQNIANALQNNNKNSDIVKNSFNTTKNSTNYTVDKINDEILRDLYKIVIFNRKDVNKSLLVNAIRGLENIKYDIIETSDRLNLLDEKKEDVEQIGTINIEVPYPVIIKDSSEGDVNYDFKEDLTGNIKTTEYILNVKITPDNKFEVSSKDIDIVSQSKLYNDKEYELNTSIKISALGEISDIGDISTYTFNHSTNSYDRKN